MAKNTQPQYETRTVKFSQVRDNPNNARNVPTEEKALAAYVKGIKDLADDIKANGNLAPMVVIMTDDPEVPYEVKEGSRRYATFNILEPETVEVRIIPFKDTIDHELIGLAGNLDRADLTPYDVAKRLVEIKEEHPSLADNMIATRIGRSKSYVQNMVRTYNGLHPKILKAWSNAHGMATTDNLVKLVKVEDKDEQWERWRVLCGDVAEAGAEGDEEGEAPTASDEPKRNAKKAASALLEAILATKTGIKAEAKAFAVQCLQYVLNARKTFPTGVEAPKVGKPGKKGNKTEE